MIISIWVFTLLGEPIEPQHGTPYAQVTASALDHDRGQIREQIEARAWEKFHRDFPGVTVHDPVYIEDGVSIERSEIGPNVSIERGTKISGSRVRNSIIGRDARLSGVELEGSLLGNGVVLESFRGSASLGDHSEAVAQRA